MGPVGLAVILGIAGGAGKSIWDSAPNPEEAKTWLRNGDRRMKRNIQRQRRNFINKFRRRK